MSAILLFDSGLGGLSVYKHIRAVVPLHPIRYLADNARFPYGELKPEELISRCIELIVSELARQPFSLVVIACNSASTLVLDELRQAIDVPVVGVVPAIKPAAVLSSNNVIGLLATPGTVTRQYTNKLKRDFAAGCELITVGSSELVRLAEKKIKGEAVSPEQLKFIVTPFLDADIRPDVVVLGCTHFPLLRTELAEVLGPSIQLLDSGLAIARRVAHLISNSPYKVFKSENVFCFTGSAPTSVLAQFLISLGFSSCFEHCTL